MKTAFRVLLFHLFLAGVTPGFLPAPLAATTATTTTKSVRAPDFELQTATGKTFRLSEYQGLTRVLFFVRNSGRYVPEVLQMMEKIVASSPEYQVKSMLLCIVATDMAPEQFTALRKRFRLKWVFLKDSDLAVHRLYKVIAVPTVVLIAPDGRISGRLAGYALSFGSRFRVSLRASLGLPALSDASEVTTATRRAARYVSLGNVLVKRGISSAALRNYRSALKIAPETHAARLGAGFCLLRMGRAKEGRTEFQQLRLAEVLTTQTHVGLAWAMGVEGKIQPARAELEKLRAVAQRLPEYYEAWEALHLASGETDKARQARDKASELRGRRVNAPVTRPKARRTGEK